MIELLPQQKPPLGDAYVLDQGNPLARGLRGLWLFNEGAGQGACDVTPFHGIGTASGDYSWTRELNGNPVLTFGGTNAQVLVPHSQALNIATGLITVEILCCPAAAGIDNLSNKLTVPVQHSFIITASQFAFYCGGTGSANRALSGAVTLNAWHHVVGTYDGANTSIYLDGIWKANATTPLAPGQNTGGYYVGRSGAATQPFHGAISKVAIYDRALSASAIEVLYREPWCMVKPYRRMWRGGR